MMMLWRALMVVGVVGAVQQWEEEPGYREVNPGGAVVMVCRVKNKLGECRCDNLLVFCRCHQFCYFFVI